MLEQRNYHDGDDDDNVDEHVDDDTDNHLQSLSHPAILQAVGCHRHCNMKTRSCKACDIKQQAVSVAAFLSCYLK